MCDQGRFTGGQGSRPPMKNVAPSAPSPHFGPASLDFHLNRSVISLIQLHIVPQAPSWNWGTPAIGPHLASARTAPVCDCRKIRQCVISEYVPGPMHQNSESYTRTPAHVHRATRFGIVDGFRNSFVRRYLASALTHLAHTVFTLRQCARRPDRPHLLRNAVITIAIRLRYDYDPTTTYIARACFYLTRFDASKNEHVNFSS